MINNIDKEEKEIEAIKLIDQAETLADRGKGEEAIKIYEKAAQIYIDLGSYLRLDELFIRIVQIISQFKNKIQAVYRLRSIIRKTEELKLDEISGKLLVQLGNFSYNMKDYETAGDSWKKASDYFYEIDPEEFYNLSSILLLKAGQALEKSKLRHDEGERLILQSVMKMRKFDLLYQEEEKLGHNLLNRKEFESAAKKFFNIASYFEDALENIDELLEDTESEAIVQNTKARLLHLTAEYLCVAMLSLRVTQNRNYNEQIKSSGNKAITVLKKSITLLKQVFNYKNIDIDKEDILRLSFDTLLLALIQDVLGEKQVNSTEYLLKNLSNKTILGKLKKTPFYKIAVKIEKVGFLNSLDSLSKIHLGHLNKVKEILIPYFLET